MYWAPKGIASVLRPKAIANVLKPKGIANILKPKGIANVLGPKRDCKIYWAGLQVKDPARQNVVGTESKVPPLLVLTNAPSALLPT